jgi:hypothetical protein
VTSRQLMLPNRAWNVNHRATGAKVCDERDSRGGEGRCADRIQARVKNRRLRLKQHG